MDLQPHQVELLSRLVDAERTTPAAQRQHFLIRNTISDSPGVELAHPGVPRDAPRVFEGDLDELAQAGVIAYANVGGASGFYVTNSGFRAHDTLMARKGESYQRPQAIVREYLDAEGFRRRYPRTSEKWQEAERLLWDTEAKGSATTVGHLTREAMQDFATALIDEFKPAGVDPDKAKTVARVRAVLNAQRSVLGNTKHAMLDALVVYWGTVSDLVQRQEHGGQRDHSALTWHDSRRVVFQAAMVMFELDWALHGLQQTG